MKSMMKTKLVGLLSQEIFAHYPDNLPKKYQKQMYEETLFMRNIAPKPEQFSPYTKGSLQLLYLSMLNINFIHKLGKKEHEAFLETNPPLKEVYNLDYIGEELPKPEMAYEEFQEFLDLDSEQVKRLQTKTVKKERFEQAWMFENWIYYQEFVMAMSLLESLFRDSYEIYRKTFPDVKSKAKIPENLDECCFIKLFDE